MAPPMRQYYLLTGNDAPHHTDTIDWDYGRPVPEPPKQKEKKPAWPKRSLWRRMVQLKSFHRYKFNVVELLKLDLYDPLNPDCTAPLVPVAHYTSRAAEAIRFFHVSRTMRMAAARIYNKPNNMYTFQYLWAQDFIRREVDFVYIASVDTAASLYQYAQLNFMSCTLETLRVITLTVEVFGNVFLGDKPAERGLAKLVSLFPALENLWLVANDRQFTRTQPETKLAPRSQKGNTICWHYLIRFWETEMMLSAARDHANWQVELRRMFATGFRSPLTVGLALKSKGHFLYCHVDVCAEVLPRGMGNGRVEGCRYGELWNKARKRTILKNLIVTSTPGIYWL